jgi:TRAP-type C4-dicarboxylate transport system substrate-binding protein
VVAAAVAILLAASCSTSETSLSPDTSTAGSTDLVSALLQANLDAGSGRIGGTIDGAERPTDYIVAEKWWALAKYVSLVHYSGDAVMVSFNKEFWNKLQPSDQKLLVDKIRQYGNKKYDVDKVAAEDAIETARKNGMIVNTVSPENLQLFRDAMKSVWTDHATTIVQPLIDAVRTVSMQK